MAGGRMELDCDDDPGDYLTEKSAKRFLSVHNHRDWQPCLPRLAALAYLSENDHEL
jgi:hypothetical protein